jgi:hypothetical protein
LSHCLQERKRQDYAVVLIAAVIEDDLSFESSLPIFNASSA